MISKPLLVGALLIVTALGVQGEASVLDLVALGGATPSEVAAVAGTPTVAPVEGDFLAEGLYAPSEGGSLTVLFCEGQAFSLQRAVVSPASTADGLLTLTGLQAAAADLALEEESEVHGLWVRPADGSAGGSPLERILVLRGETGWDRVEVDFSSAC